MKKPQKKVFRKTLTAAAALIIAIILFSGMAPIKQNSVQKNNNADTLKISAVDTYSKLYEDLKLGSFQLSKDAYNAAVKGYQNLLRQGAIKKQDVLSIVDFSLPSSQKRLFILDLLTGKLLFNTYVSHGRNSGLEQATQFSNETNSHKSSLGFFVTGKTYQGKHGFSLKLDGLEKGINDNAYSRGIVMHAANYVNEKLAMKRGYIGRSFGCPALPVELYKPIIQKIQDGSCLFLYAPDTSYTARSMMNSNPNIYPETKI